ncbi:MAG: hypothetical protein JNL80_10650 [Phycisphaerae bacterium]|jgi:hypothetical protein|nr:hypothetical protein [Phycisphaerae bacterium]
MRGNTTAALAYWFGYADAAGPAGGMVSQARANGAHHAATVAVVIFDHGPFSLRHRRA